MTDDLYDCQGISLLVGELMVKLDQECKYCMNI